MKQKMNYLTYIIAGIRKKPGRNLATIFCFAFIAASIFSGQFLMAGAARSVDQGLSRTGADIAVVPTRYLIHLGAAGPDNTMAIVRIEPTSYRIPVETMNMIRTVAGITAASPQLYVSTLDLPEIAPMPVDIYGIDPETDFAIQPWLKAPLKAPLGPGEVIAGNSIPGKVSSTIPIAGNEYTIVGKLDPTQSGIDHTLFFRMEDASTLASTDGVFRPDSPRINPGEINAVLIRIGPEPDWFRTSGTLDFKPSYPGFIKDVIRKQFEPTYATAIGRHYAITPMSEEITGIPDFLSIISGIVVVAAFPLIALIAAMVAHERQHEIGLLRALGAKRRIIAVLVISEASFLALIGGILGVTASILVFFLLDPSGILAPALQVSFRMPGWTEAGVIAVLAVLIVLAIGSIASLYPAYQSSRMNPYEAIQRGGN